MVKMSIVHQFTELKASVVGTSSGIGYTTVGFSSAVADPGIPVGGAWISDVGAFW